MQVMGGDEWMRDTKIYLAQIRAEKIEAEEEAAVMATQVSIRKDEPITERLLQYSLNPQKVWIVLTKLLRWAKKKPDIQMQTSLMISEESQYADILVARGAQRKHLAKETENLQTEAVKLGRSDGEIEISIKYPSQRLYSPRSPSRLHRVLVLAPDFTNPIIIPKGLAADRLVLDAHQRWMHASQKMVFNSLRQKYWFIGGFMCVNI